MKSFKKGIDWDIQPLGEMKDVDLARKLGCSQSAVFDARKRRNIPPFFRPVAWDAVKLGSTTDTEIARRLGVHVESVASARYRRGIAPYTPQLPRTVLPNDATLELMHCRHQLSPADIAKRFACNASTIAKRLRTLGVLRSRREAYDSPLFRIRISEGRRNPRPFIDEAAE
jgi:hypothetical protein